MKEKEARAKFRQVGVTPWSMGPTSAFLGLAYKEGLPVCKWPFEGPLGFVICVAALELGPGVISLPATVAYPQVALG